MWVQGRDREAGFAPSNYTRLPTLTFKGIFLSRGEKILPFTSDLRMLELMQSNHRKL